MRERQPNAPEEYSDSKPFQGEKTSSESALVKPSNNNDTMNSFWVATLIKMFPSMVRAPLFYPLAKYCRNTLPSRPSTKATT
jgi:hypothetical protein